MQRVYRYLSKYFWNFLSRILGCVGVVMLTVGLSSCAGHNTIADPLPLPSEFATKNPIVKKHIDFDALSSDEQEFLKNFIQEDRTPYSAFSGSFRDFITAHPKLQGYIEYNLPHKGNKPVLVLRNWNFSNVDLSDANFSNAVLLELGCYKTNLSRAHFSGSFVKDGDFTESDLSSAHFVGAFIDLGDFTGANLSSAHFTSTVIRTSRFKHADLANARFTRTKFFDVFAQYANFSRASFTDASLSNVNFQHSNLDYAHFTNVELHKVDFTDADISRIKYSPGDRKNK